MATVSFTDETTLGDRHASWAMEIFEESLPLRELIRRRIHQEVAEYNAAQPEVFRGLVRPTGAAVAQGGFRLERPRRIDAEQQYELAVQAFTRNGFVVLVGDDDRAVEPLPLDRIPALVLSEIMRDVDLFVGVASIGNDPTWSDGGPDGRFRDYWSSYSFGELSATAQTRRDLVTRLLPRLAVGARATVDGRFLVVRGELRTYKIHLGSGNILMSPGDTYLCIVPDRNPAHQTEVRLPFEGDGTLAVILSKAMLLAKDSQITDPTITGQLRTTG